MAAPQESTTLRFIRKLLFGSLAIGIAGTGGELILLGHIESPAQWLPLVALGAAVPVLAWHARRPRRMTVRALQMLMMSFIALGVVGVGLHYDGNVEFERELHPDEPGWTAWRHTIAGATPLLAPGSMVLLGLIGFAQVHRHPAMEQEAE